MPPNASPARNDTSIALRLRAAIGTDTPSRTTKATTSATTPAVLGVTCTSSTLALATSSARPRTLAPAAQRSRRRSGVSNTQCDAITVMPTWPATIACTATIGM